MTDPAWHLLGEGVSRTLLLAFVALASGLAVAVVALAFRVFMGGVRDPKGRRFGLERRGFGRRIGIALGAVIAMAFLGGLTGYTMALSRTGVVGAVIPAVLTALAGALGFLVGRDFRHVPHVAGVVVAFALGFMTMQSIAADMRVVVENEGTCERIFADADLLSDEKAFGRARALYLRRCFAEEDAKMLTDWMGTVEKARAEIARAAREDTEDAQSANDAARENSAAGSDPANTGAPTVSGLPEEPRVELDTQKGIGLLEDLKVLQSEQPLQQ